MDNSSERIFEFSYKVPGYDFVSANAALYAFLGPRLYITADRLFTENSIAVLDKAFKDKAYGQTFVVTVENTDGSDILMAAQLIRREEDTPLINVRMIELNRLFNGYYELMIKEKESDALLAQNDCTYFSYDKKTDMVTSYRYDIGKELQARTTGKTNFLTNCLRTARRLFQSFCPTLETA